MVLQLPKIRLLRVLTDLVRSDGSQQEDSSEKQDNPKDEASAGSENTEKKKVLIPDEVLIQGRISGGIEFY